MPCQEFEELMIPASDYSGPAALARKPDGRINCWGYVKTHHFAPKASLCRKKDRDPAGEFRELVKAMHAAGIEVFTELYFDGTEDSAYVTSVLRWYVRFFRVDGLHIMGFADIEAASRDPYLARTKIIAQYWKEMPRKGPKLLASCNENFQRDMRRYLKGDEGTLNSLVFHTKNNPLGAAVINYMANTNGFTMMDMVSYDRKHNELNGEGNTDGPDGNFSWNCGVEGPTRKRKITELRRQQLRNAFLLLLLSQGTPLIMAGDEFGNTQDGNNNAYCQDNALWWLNWKLVKSEKALLDFVKKAIAFRKKHRVFHLPEQPKVLDPRATGLPDVSYHGVRAWQPEFDDWHRQLGILYNGRYAADENGVPDNTFYVMYNLHWESHSFALPHPVNGYQWYIAANTADTEVNGFYPEGEEPAVTGGPEFEVPARGIVVLISKEAQKPARKPKKAAKKDGKKAEKETGKKAEKKAAEETAEEPVKEAAEEMTAEPVKETAEETEKET
jgi:glycogen operon protein